MSKKSLVTFLVLIIFLVMPGSPARAAELRIAIFPFSVHTQDDISYIRDGITSLMPSRIALSGRLSVIDSFLVRSELGKLPAEHPLSADVALGKKLKADYILIGSITKIDDILNGNGMFSRLGEQWFDNYWMNYGKITITTPEGKTRKITNLVDFVQYRGGDVSLVVPKSQRYKQER